MVNPFIPLLNSYLPEPEAGLLVGMLFGVTSSFTPEFKEALITTGTIHVVALSGANISMITNLIAKFTFFLGRRISAVISLAGVIVFILFVGPSPTVVRAGIMGGISLLGVYFGRQVFALWSLVLTGAVMVLFDFTMLSNVSFQLSFFSTLGILVFAPTPLKNVPTSRSENVGSRDPDRIVGNTNFIRLILKDIKGVFWENLRTTLAAQVGTLPIILFTFNRVSIISPVSNVLIGWTVAPATIFGLIASLVGIIIPPLGWVISWIAYVFLAIFVFLVDLTSKIPFASLTLDV